MSDNAKEARRQAEVLSQVVEEKWPLVLSTAAASRSMRLENNFARRLKKAMGGIR